MQCQVKRPVVDEKHFFRLAPDQSRDALSVARPQEKRFQDQQVQRSLQ